MIKQQGWSNIKFPSREKATTPVTRGILKLSHKTNKKETANLSYEVSIILTPKPRKGETTKTKIPDSFP